MFGITLLAVSTALITLTAVERLHHVSNAEAALSHTVEVSLILVLVFLIGLFAYVVSRFRLLKKHAGRQERIIQKIEDSRARYKALVNSINDFIIITDTEGYVIYANERAVQFTGLSQEDLLGQEIRQVLGREDGPPPGDTICSVMADSHLNGEFSLPCAGGFSRWVSCKCTPLKGKEGGIDGLILTIRDIGDLKEKETQLIAARDAAEQGSRAKSAFLANMSHELRTPLSSILGYSQFLEMQKAGPLNEKQRAYVDTIIASGNHLLEMVNDILDLAKIEAGKTAIDRKPFDINLMLSRSPSTIKAVADKKKVRMELNIQPAMGLLNADEVRLKQVIYNLLGNAIKFTDAGKRVGLDAVAMGNTVVISIWDEGCGIRPEDQERIFLPFEQSDEHRRQGTGLGLSIVKKIVEMHGGSISVASTPGSGTRFSVVIPGRIEMSAAEDLPRAAETDSRATQSMQGKKVLLVDDNDDITRLVREVLSSNGYYVTSCKNGMDALTALEGGARPDVMLMDIGLPDGENRKVLSRIKELVDPSVRVIALTGFAMKGDREKFLNIGFDDYVSKPFKIDSFMVKLGSTMVN